MASGLTPYYLLQPAFTGGEISAEVANRVDLDKYQLAVLQAYNCLIKPHGPIYRRPGMKYMARTKYSDKACILVPFNGADNTDYLLEIGEKYIRVHKNGLYINIEVMTPYTADMLQDLRFVQSADTMFIASGKYPVKQLARYSDTDWRFADFEITDMYFDESTSLENYSGISYTVPGTYQFQPPVTGEYQIDIAGAGGGGGGGGALPRILKVGGGQVGAVGPLQALAQGNGVGQAVVADIPAFSVAGNQGAGAVIGNKAFEAVDQNILCEGVVGHARIQAVGNVAQNKGQFLGGITGRLGGSGGGSCFAAGSRRNIGDVLGLIGSAAGAEQGDRQRAGKSGTDDFLFHVYPPRKENNVCLPFLCTSRAQ